MTEERKNKAVGTARFIVKHDYNYTPNVVNLAQEFLDLVSDNYQDILFKTAITPTEGRVVILSEFPDTNGSVYVLYEGSDPDAYVSLPLSNLTLEEDYHPETLKGVEELDAAPAGTRISQGSSAFCWEKQVNGVWQEYHLIDEEALDVHWNSEAIARVSPERKVLRWGPEKENK